MVIYADDTNRRDDREIYEGFAKFLKAMKAAQPEKYLVMNSVSNYGRRNIVGSGSIEFAYNEMWEGERWYTSSEMRLRVIGKKVRILSLIQSSLLI